MLFSFVSSILHSTVKSVQYSTGQFCTIFLPIVLFLPQLADAYRNLQNTNRRHLNVHEPLIYDAVWLTAEVLTMSLPALSESNLTLNSSQRSPALISALNSALESNTYSGLTVKCCFAVLVLYDIKNLQLATKQHGIHLCHKCARNCL